ncbi:MAG: hypothetical protein H7330_14005 [Hymenobacteraceae bacterium]|nr:hypothetical protein [Hymenobacteraceae bacterium]
MILDMQSPPADPLDPTIDLTAELAPPPATNAPSDPPPADEANDVAEAADVAKDAEDNELLDEAAEDAAFEATLTAAQAETYRRLGPLLAISVAACDFLWHLAHKEPILEELRRRTGLNPRVLDRLRDVMTPAALERVWDDELPAYYYVLIVGRLVLESPLRPLFRELMSTDSKSAAQLDDIIARIRHFVVRSSPTTERWLIGERGSAAASPPPTDPTKVAELAGWATRRAWLEDYFQRAAPQLERVGVELLKSLPPPKPTPDPTPRGPFLRRTFTDAELAALRLLLTYVPTLTTLLPGQSFARAMHGLSALQPPVRVADLLQRLRVIKPGQPLHFALPDCLTLFQTLQSGALLLLRASSGELVRALRRHADDPHDPDEDLRIERGRLLFLLADSNTRTQFRDVFAPLLKSFSAAIDRTYPYAPELAKARAELADLASVR